MLQAWSSTFFLDTLVSQLPHLPAPKESLGPAGSDIQRKIRENLRHLRKIIIAPARYLNCRHLME